MKKFILLLVALIGFAFTQAQTVTYTALDASKSYVAVATDYTLSAATVRTFVFPAASHYPCTQDYVIKLDTTVGTNHTSIAVALYGQKSTVAGDWTQIGTTKTWTLGTNDAADTTIIISNATANRFRLYKAVVTGVGTGAVGIVANQELKLFWE